MGGVERKQSKPWGRADQIAGEVMLWLIVVAGAVLVPVVAVRALLATRLEVPVELDGAPSASPGEQAGRFRLGSVEEAVLVVTDPTTGDRIADAAPAMVLFAAMALAAWLLLRVLRTLRTGDPFSWTNLRRVRGLAITLFAAAYVWAAVTAIGRWHFADAAQAAVGSGVSIDRWIGVPVWPLVTAMVLGAVAEFLRRGAALREDVDGLV